MVQPPFVDDYTRRVRGQRSSARWVFAVAAVWAALVVGSSVAAPRRTDALGNPTPRVPLDVCWPLVLLAPCVGLVLFGRHLARQARDLGEAPFTVQVSQHPLRLGAEVTLEVATSRLRPRSRIVVSLECNQRFRRKRESSSVERDQAVFFQDRRHDPRGRAKKKRVWTSKVSQRLLEVASVAVEEWPLRATFTVPTDAPPSESGPTVVVWSIRVVPDEGAEVEQPLEVLAP